VAQPKVPPLTVDALDAIPDDDKRKDLVDEREALQSHGVPHHWIMDVEDPLLTVLRLGADGYVIAATVDPGEHARLEPNEAVELEVSRLFGDLGGASP
jgi:hypothetical protein